MSAMECRYFGLTVSTKKIFERNEKRAAGLKKPAAFCGFSPKNTKKQLFSNDIARIIKR